MLRHDGGRHFTGVGPWRGPLLEQFRQAKVENLRVAVARDHYVIGFEIAVDDPCAVCARQTLSRVLQELEQLSKLNSLVMNLLAQRHAIDKLHCDELGSVVLADFMDGSDVRMIKRRG